MPEGSGRTGNPGNMAGGGSSGRSGSAGNVDGAPHKARQPGSMSQHSSIAGRSLTPGNDGSLKIPSNAAGSMGQGPGKVDSSGIPGRSKGKFDYASSKGLLKR
jgi:hypothetical protein